MRVGSPGQPGSVTAAKANPGQIRVSFAAPANNGATINTYTAGCNSSNGGTNNTSTANAPAAPIVVTGLTVGQVVHVRRQGDEQPRNRADLAPDAGRERLRSTHTTTLTARSSLPLKSPLDDSQVDASIWCSYRSRSANTDESTTRPGVMPEFRQPFEARRDRPTRAP